MQTGIAGVYCHGAICIDQKQFLIKNKSKIFTCIQPDLQSVGGHIPKAQSVDLSGGPYDATVSRVCMSPLRQVVWFPKSFALSPHPESQPTLGVSSLG